MGTKCRCVELIDDERGEKVAPKQAVIEKLDCPLGDYTANSKPETALLAEMIDHIVDNHPGNLDPLVVNTIKTVTSRFK